MIQIDTKTELQRNSHIFREHKGEHQGSMTVMKYRKCVKIGVWERMTISQAGDWGQVKDTFKTETEDPLWSLNQREVN